MREKQRLKSQFSFMKFESSFWISTGNILFFFLALKENWDFKHCFSLPHPPSILLHFGDMLNTFNTFLNFARENGGPIFPYRCLNVQDFFQGL